MFLLKEKKKLKVSLIVGGSNVRDIKTKIKMYIIGIYLQLRINFSIIRICYNVKCKQIHVI